MSEAIRMRADGALVGRVIVPVFATTLCLSAFLLFSVQPFFTKLLLPRLGGSPGIWSTAMVFFQAMLLAGYAYAYGLSRLSLKTSSIIHVAVLAMAFASLPLSVPAGWETPPESGQAVWLLGLFASAVGLPFFAISANGALMQAWFSKTSHPHASDPYFLYGASNIGSFASLILYIVAIEPMLTLTQQSAWWTGGYVLLTVAIAACAIFALKSQKHVTQATARSVMSAPVSLRTVAVWVLLGFVPSGLLVATTAHISTDVAAAPFLWVLPLALFLLTFVLAFRSKPLIATSRLGEITTVMGCAAFISLYIVFAIPSLAQIALHLAFYFCAAYYCHSLLYERRPDADRLTGFYLAMSFGGVLGGIFTSLIAPYTFNWIAEYPILIVIALAVGPLLRPMPIKDLRYAAILAAIVAVAALGASRGIDTTIVVGYWVFIIVGLAFAAIALRRRSERSYVGLVACMLLAAFAAGRGDDLFRLRSFFGVVTVSEADGGRTHRMRNGTTTHGAQMVEDESGAPITGRPEPTTYYHPKGGIAETIRVFQKTTVGAPGKAGVVGLGAGSVACYAQPGEDWRFYEIDRTVVDAARDPRLFTFLSTCGPDMPVVIGDARLTLASEPQGKFDYLLIDAFSSDSIPTHLMTREAIELYRSKLKPGGLLAMHISNRYLELASVLAAIGNDLGVQVRTGLFDQDKSKTGLDLSTQSHVAVFTNNPEQLALIDADPRWSKPDAGTTAAWTDDYSNIFAALIRGQPQSLKP